MSHLFLPQQSNRAALRAIRAARLGALGDDYDANGNGVPDAIEAAPLDSFTAAGANAVMTTVIASMRAAISFTSSAAKASQYAAVVPPAPTIMQSLLGPIYEAAGLVAGAVNYADGAFANRRDAYLSALNTMTTITNRLDGPDRADVIAATLPLRKWLDAALVVQQGIYGILKDISADLTTPTNLWDDIQNGYDFLKEQAGKLPDPTNPLNWLLWGIPIAIVGSIVLSVWLAPEIGAARSVARAAGDGARALRDAAKKAKAERDAQRAARSGVNGIETRRKQRKQRRNRR